MSSSRRPRIIVSLPSSRRHTESSKTPETSFRNILYSTHSKRSGKLLLYSNVTIHNRYVTVFNNSNADKDHTVYSNTQLGVDIGPDIASNRNRRIHRNKNPEMRWLISYSMETAIVFFNFPMDGVNPLETS